MEQHNLWTHEFMFILMLSCIM